MSALPSSKDDSQSQDSQATQPYSSPQDSQSVWGTLLPNSDAMDQKVYELRGREVTIGRGKQCTISLRVPQMSSHHCTLIYIEDQNVIKVRDESTNGTWINKTRLQKETSLVQDGDEIVFVPASKKRKRKKISYFVRESSVRQGMSNDTDMSVSTFTDKYSIEKTLGAGAFAEVKLVRLRIEANSEDKTSEAPKFAMKEINVEQWQRIKHATNRDITLLDEVKIMQKVGAHENIVSVIEYFEEKNKIYVVMDFCDGGDMLDYIQKHQNYSNDHARELFRQITSAISYMHNELSIAHRDLKPDNILLCGQHSEQIKISDFGISRKSTQSMNCQTIIGTPLYQAPEVQLNRSKHRDGYDGKLADIWSMGVILYIMLVAAPPAGDPQEIVQMAENSCFLWYDEPVVELAKDLIYSMLKVNPKERITAREILQHPWIKGFDTREEAKTGIKKPKDESDSKDNDKDKENKDNDKDKDKEKDKEKDSNNGNNNNNNNNNGRGNDESSDGKDNSSDHGSTNGGNFKSYSFNNGNQSGLSFDKFDFVSSSNGSSSSSSMKNTMEDLSRRFSNSQLSSNEMSVELIDNENEKYCFNNNNNNNNNNKNYHRRNGSSIDKENCSENENEVFRSLDSEDESDNDNSNNNNNNNNNGNQDSNSNNNSNNISDNYNSNNNTSSNSTNSNSNKQIDNEQDDDIFFFQQQNPKPHKSLKRKLLNPTRTSQESVDSINSINSNNSSVNSFNSNGSNPNSVAAFESNSNANSQQAPQDLMDQPPPKKRQRIIAAK